MTRDDLILKKLEELSKGQKRVEQGLSRLETRQNTVEEGLCDLKIEFKDTKAALLQAIKDSQQDTIEVVRMVIHEAYNLHEERILRIETHLHFLPVKQ